MLTQQHVSGDLNSESGSNPLPGPLAIESPKELMLETMNRGFNSRARNHESAR